MDKKAWALFSAVATIVCGMSPCMADEIPTLKAENCFEYNIQSPEEVLESSEWLQAALSSVEIEGVDTSKFSIVLDNTSESVLTKQYAKVCEEFKKKGFGESYVIDSPEAINSGKNAQQLFKETYGNLFEESKLKKSEIPADFDTKAVISTFLTEREMAYDSVINASDSLFKKVANQISIGTSSYNAALNTNTVEIWSEDKLRDQLNQLNASTDANVKEKYGQFVNDMPDKVSLSLKALTSTGGKDLTSSTKSEYSDTVNKMFVSLTSKQTTNGTVVDNIDNLIMVDKDGNEISDVLKAQIVDEAKKADKTKDYTTKDVYSIARNYVKTENGLYAKSYGNLITDKDQIEKKTSAILDYSGLNNDEITEKILSKYEVFVDPSATFNKISEKKSEKMQQEVEKEKQDKQNSTEIVDNPGNIDYQIETLKMYNSAIYDAIVTSGGKPGTAMDKDALRQYITIAGYNITASSYVKMKYNYFQSLYNAGYLDDKGNGTSKIQELDSKYLLYPDFNIAQSSELAAGYTRDQADFIYNATIVTCCTGNPYY